MKPHYLRTWSRVGLREQECDHRSRTIAETEVQLLLRARGRGTTKDLDTVGTSHFAQFVPLEDNT
jgi:hypothetical protein